MKQVADTTVHGEVSANPLNPRPSKVFVIRLQEFAGRATTVEVATPVKVRAARSESDRGCVDDALSTDRKLKPYETALRCALISRSVCPLNNSVEALSNRSRESITELRILRPAELKTRAAPSLNLRSQSRREGTNWMKI